MKKLTISLLTLLVSVSAFSQIQDFSQNMFSQLNYNPAVAGIAKESSIDLGARSQLNQYPGMPVEYVGNVMAYLPCINSGLGITFNDNELGYENAYLYKFSYSYHIRLCSGTLGVGVSAGDYNVALSGPFYGGGPYSYSYFDIGAGVYYLSACGAYAGVSMTYLTNHNAPIAYDYAHHYYINGGVPIHLNEELELIPDILIEPDAAFTNGLFDVRVQNKDAWIGAGYWYYGVNSYPAFNIIAGAQHEFKNGMGFRIGYSYDFPNTPSGWGEQTNNGGTHEIHLQYFINQKPKEVVK